MLERIVSDAPVFLFVAVRCFATIMTLPLFSSRTVPRTAKIALAGYMAFFIFRRFLWRMEFFLHIKTIFHLKEIFHLNIFSCLPEKR